MDARYALFLRMESKNIFTVGGLRKKANFASMNTAQKIIAFFDQLKEPSVKTEGVEVLNPLKRKETTELIASFYSKYYNDKENRIAFIGINPGRLGSGLTGIGFTDPVNLEEVCGIKNSFQKKHELSSRFIYDMIAAYGGARQFYKDVFISSTVPLGFVKDNVNLNYYDIKSLEEELTPYIVEQFNKQLPFLRRDVAFVIGKGKNLKFLEKLNKKHHFFERLEVLPHPRWVMQYRLKRKQEFIAEFVTKIQNEL